MEVGLTAFQFKFSTDYGKLMAGSVVSVLPMLVDLPAPAPAHHRERGADRPQGISRRDRERRMSAGAQITFCSRSRAMSAAP